MRPTSRRTATRVRRGRLRKKNNWHLDRKDSFAVGRSDIQLDRRAAGRGYRHLVTIAQLRAFVELLPDWEAVAVGLTAIVLDGGGDIMGWHTAGIVAICAWEQDLWWPDTDSEFEEVHREVLDLLGVVRAPTAPGKLELQWTSDQARAFQLLHVLPHELGHHRDRMTSRSKRRAPRGEDYAERYALRALDLIWPEYGARFGL